MARQGASRARRGRYRGDGGGIAVIGRAGHDEARAAGPRLGDSQGEVVRLAARAGHHEMGDRRGEGRQQALGIGIDDRAQIARVDVEPGGLAGYRLDDTRMAMPDGRHVVVGIEIATAIRPGHPDARRLDHVDGVAIEQDRPGPEASQPALDAARPPALAGAARLRIEGVEGQDVGFARHAVLPSRRRSRRTI